MYDPPWTCRDGRVLRIGAMETSHVENCIAKINRSRTGWRREFLPRLELELRLRDMGMRT